MQRENTPTPRFHRSGRLAALPEIAHGFTTRDHGPSEGPWGPLTLARRAEVPAAEIAEAWRRVLAALPGPPPDRLAIVDQVHGADVVEVRAPGGPFEPVARADGAWTAHTDLALAVRVADCVPVLIAGPRGIAVAHAGWRGTAAGVVPATIRALCDGTGMAPGELTAAVGPHICGDAYEVGDEVVAALRDAGLRDADFVHAHHGPRPHVDLGRAVVAQAAALGVRRIDRLEWCTFHDPALHSHRRDGALSGRLAGVIARRG